MSLEVSQRIHIERVGNSRIREVDFDNLPFGEIRTDHMLVCEYSDGKWGAPKIVPYQNLSLDPAAKYFITASLFLKA